MGARGDKEKGNLRGERGGRHGRVIPHQQRFLFFFFSFWESLKIGDGDGGVLWSTGVIKIVKINYIREKWSGSKNNILL